MRWRILVPIGAVLALAGSAAPATAPHPLLGVDYSHVSYYGCGVGALDGTGIVAF